MRSCPDTRDERGAGTVLAGSFLALLLVVGAAIAALGGLLRANRQAQAAADLGALAGASALQRGDQACAAAARLVAANQARSTECEIRGTDVVVRAEVRVSAWWGVVATPSAQARAGPGGPP
ncbi:MAG: Rv3654c family TadE-like protein [Nocardioides sp.]